MKKIIFVIALLVGAMNLSAQTFFSGNKKVGPLPCSGLKLMSSNETDALDPKTATVTLEQFVFQNGYKTVLLTVDSPELREGLGHPAAYYWRGNDVKFFDQSGTYCVMTNTGKVCCGITTTQGKTIAVLSDDPSNGLVSGLWKGQTVEQVKAATADKFKGTKFVQLANEGNMKVYSMKWFQMTNSVDRFGKTTANLNNNKEYMRFYFDANGKLLKWYQTVSNK